MALDDISFSPVHCQNQTGESHSFSLIWNVPALPDAQSWHVSLTLITTPFVLPYL